MSDKDMIWSWRDRWTNEGAGEFMGILLERAAEARAEVQKRQQEMVLAGERARDAEDKMDRAVQQVDMFMRGWQSATCERNEPENKARYQSEMEGLEMKVPVSLVEGTL
jgi:hypothetical protein